jgi:TPR repeat protein
MNIHNLLLKSNGCADAQYELANCYYNGEGGVKTDINKAFKWFKRAAKQGHVDAMYDMGRFYEYDEDYKKALRWYEKAAKAGHGDGYYMYNQVVETMNKESSCDKILHPWIGQSVEIKYFDKKTYFATIQYVFKCPNGEKMCNVIYDKDECTQNITLKSIKCDGDSLKVIF